MPEIIGVREQVPAPPVDNTLISGVISLIILIVVIGVIILGIILFLKWWSNRKNEKEDIYTQDYKKTIEQCKINRNSKWLRPVMNLPMSLISKGVPVELRYPPLLHSKQYAKLSKENEKKIKERIDKLEIKSPRTKEEETELNNLLDMCDPQAIELGYGETYKLGSYAGDCITMDGCRNILVKSAREKILGIFPKLFIVKIRLPSKQRIIDQEEKKRVTKIIDVPPDSASFSNDVITIDSLGLEKYGEYWYPVTMNKEGQIVDKKPYIANDMWEIASQIQVLDFGRSVVRMGREWVSSSPIVRLLKDTGTELGQE